MAMFEYTRKSKKAFERYGYQNCVLAFQMHQKGEGAATIAATHPDERIRTVRQADAAINAGREAAQIDEHCTNFLRVTRNGGCAACQRAYPECCLAHGGPQ